MSNQDSKIKKLQKSLIVAIRLAGKLHMRLAAVNLLKVLDEVTGEGDLQNLAKEFAKKKPPPSKTKKLNEEKLEFTRFLSGGSLQKRFEDAVEESFQLALDLDKNSAAASLLAEKRQF